MAPAVADEDAEAEGPLVPAVGVLESQGEAGLGPAVIWEPELKRMGVTPVRGGWPLGPARDVLHRDPPQQKPPDTAAAETSL